MRPYNFPWELDSHQNSADAGPGHLNRLWNMIDPQHVVRMLARYREPDQLRALCELGTSSIS